jgi:plasmid maintenance system antidote protein VapI
VSEQVEKLSQLLNENLVSIEEFANCLGITEQQARAYCEGSKKLSASLQRQIEQTFSKPSNWFTAEAESEGPNFDLFG